MKMNIKKVATIVGSALMIGATAGMAAAAAYPAPFVSSGSANVAIVVGGNAALSDGLAASAISADLASDLAAQTATGTTTATGATATGGDSYKIEKASTKFQFGNGIANLDDSLADKELPLLLKDMVFMDNDNDEFDYKQTVALANLTLNLFDDDEYKVDTPTVGLNNLSDGSAVLNYTLDFTENPYWSDLDTADLTLLGKTYYVLSTSANNTITLLDSATDTEINEGETTTLTVGAKTYEVSAKITSATQVKLTVNGESTNTLSALQTQKLSDGSYVGIKEISYNSKESGVSSVEFSIGKGKLVLTNGDEVQINDNDVDNLVVAFTNSSGDVQKIDSMVIKWSADNDLFVTEDTSITMPGFEAIKLSFGGMSYPAEETFTLKADGTDKIMLKDFETKETKGDIYLLNGGNGNYSLIGKDSNNRLATSGNGRLNFTEGTHDMFVLSYVSGDEGESYLVRATNFDDTDSATLEQTVDFEYLVDGTWKDLDTAVNGTEEVSIGSAAFTVDWVSNETAKTVNLSVSGSNSFNKLISKEGLQVTLPWTNATVLNLTNATVYSATDACALWTATAAHGYGAVGGNVGVNTSTVGAVIACNSTSYSVIFDEEDKDDAIAGGPTFNVTVGLDSDLEVTISSITGDTSAYEIGETEVFRSFVASALSTEIKDDQSGDHESVSITYHGGESYGNVFVLAPSATVSAGAGSTTSATQLGAITVKDSEVSSVSGKNLIVIGGSCVNSVAAELLGGAACDAAFTAKSGVKAGEALIKSFDRSGKIALLVAGYNAEDTTKAATYLTMKGANTTVGAALKVTSATEATAITA